MPCWHKGWYKTINSNAKKPSFDFREKVFLVCAVEYAIFVNQYSTHASQNQSDCYFGIKISGKKPDCKMLNPDAWFEILFC